jgi:hypothetical protein
MDAVLQRGNQVGVGLPFPFPLIPAFHLVGLPDYRGNIPLPISIPE